MSQIRPIDLATDLAILRKWWDGHGALSVPENLLAQGCICTSGGVDICAAFYYMDVSGRIAVIEWLTTNPSVAFSRYLVDDVRRLIAHIEALAYAQCDKAGSKGCTILSFVAPGTGEERLWKSIGYTTSEGPSHRIYAKTTIPSP